MKPSIILKAILAAVVFPIAGAWAEEIIVSTDSVSATRAALAENGLDWALVPKNPSADFKNAVRGVFSQNQAAAAQRALSGDGIKKHAPFAATSAIGQQIEIPSPDKEAKPAFALTAMSQPEGKIVVKISGLKESSAQEAKITSDDVIVISLPTADPGTVDVYFVRIKKG